MSKLTKLINNPKLFFVDMIKKRMGLLEPKKETKKVEPKKETKKAEPKKDSYQFNPFEQYTHLIHSGENVTGLSHLDLWIPVFKKADIKFVVLVRNFELFNLLKEKYPELTIVFAKNNEDVSYYLNQMNFLKATFHPSNTGRNLHVLMFNKLKHIFIGHGDSDKTASAHKYFRVYDENWVAGEAHIDRFKNEGFDFRGLKQVKVGRPNLKEILQISETPWRERFGGELRLLYLSTWEGVYEEQNYTSVYFIENFFNEIILKNIFSEIHIKLHPWIGKRDTRLSNINNNLKSLFNQFDNIFTMIYDKTTPVEELIKKSNVFICDISAVISESLAANGPIFVYIPKDKNIKLTQSKMKYEDYCYVFSNKEELLEKIEEVIINGNDYLANKREEAMEYILGKRETLNDEFIKQLKEISNGRY